MGITFVTRKFGNVERNSHCDVLHITPIRVARLVLDCNGVFAIKDYTSVIVPPVNKMAYFFPTLKIRGRLKYNVLEILNNVYDDY